MLSLMKRWQILMLLCNAHLLCGQSVLPTNIIHAHSDFLFLMFHHCLLLLLSPLQFSMILWTISHLVLKLPHVCIFSMPMSLLLNDHLFSTLFARLSMIFLSFPSQIALLSLSMNLMHFISLSVLSLLLCLPASLLFLILSTMLCLMIILPQLIYGFMIFDILLLYSQ